MAGGLPFDQVERMPQRSHHAREAEVLRWPLIGAGCDIVCGCEVP